MRTFSHFSASTSENWKVMKDKESWLCKAACDKTVQEAGQICLVHNIKSTSCKSGDARSTCPALRCWPWAESIPPTRRLLLLMRPCVTETIARSCTAEPNIGETLCKELSLVFGLGSRGRIGQWRMGAWGAAACGWAGYSLLEVISAGPGQVGRAAPGLGEGGCRSASGRAACGLSCQPFGRPWAAPTGWWAGGIASVTLVDIRAELAHRGSPAPGREALIFFVLQGILRGGQISTEDYKDDWRALFHPVG